MAKHNIEFLNNFGKRIRHLVPFQQDDNLPFIDNRTYYSGEYMYSVYENDDDAITFEINNVLGEVMFAMHISPSTEKASSNRTVDDLVIIVNTLIAKYELS